MPDPFSVAASAAGIASLGIQVCGGLNSYLRSIEGRNQQITHDFREIQTLVSIFDSLNDILPQIDRRGSADSAIIRQCLNDSEKRLLEFQQLLIKLRGPENPRGVKGKMKEAGSLLIYPFCEGKLVSLRQTLQRLLDKLNSTIHIASFELGIAHYDEIHTIKASVEGLEASSHYQSDGVRDLHTQMQENSDQLRSLRGAVAHSINDIQQRLSRTQCSIQDLDHNTSGHLSLIQTDMRSIASTSLVTSKSVAEMMEKFNQIYPSLNQIIEDKSHHHRISQHSPSSTDIPQPHLSGPSSKEASHPATSTNMALTRAIMTGPGLKPPTCDCPLESRSTTRSYTFWGSVLQFDHQQPSKHHRGCKLYGINQRIRRNIKAQIPLRIGVLFRRVSHVYIAYTSGDSNLGMSVRLKNVVPWGKCPVRAECSELWDYFKSSESRSSEEIVRRLKTFERAVLSIYKEGKSSPTDRDESGKSHSRIFLQLVMYPEYFRSISSDQSITAVVLQILQTLVDLVKVEDEKVDLGDLIDHLRHSFYDMAQDQQMNMNWMISYIGDVFTIDIGNILSKNIFANVIPLLKHLPIVDRIAVSPMVRAILLRSLEDLEGQIWRDPKASMEMFYGFTTLQLCATWPQGLQKLLMTEAKSLIDNGSIPDMFNPNGFFCYLSPVIWAIRFRCAESVDLLMKAGCSMPFDERTSGIFSGTSHECAAIIASNLADRRRSLLELAQRELGYLQPQNTSHVADGKAAYIYEALGNSGISIPRSLEVEWDYATIYHFPGTLIHHFRIFFEQGFRDFKSHDNTGLTPIMVWRDTFFTSRYPSSDQIFETLLWLHKQGFLDQKPKDPWKMGLNIHATGWHYVAAMFGSDYHDEYLGPDIEIPLGSKMIKKLSQVTARDRCVCWCNPEGMGCSPLKSLWKAHVDRGGMLQYQIRVYERRGEDLLRHILFHHDINVTGIENNEPSNLSLQLVRLLTFEALDMTHTCCALQHVNLEEERLCMGSDYDCDWIDQPFVIANCDPETLQRIRSDNDEQQNAHQLEILMEEFTEHMKWLDPSPKSLEIFIWGYWRRRISELFIVKPDLLDEVERVLGTVRTYVLPERLETFFEYDFDLLRPDTQARPEGENEEEDDSISVEDIGVSRSCAFCDGDEEYDEDSDGGDDSDNDKNSGNERQ